jgi:hypothetical protein
MKCNSLYYLYMDFIIFYYNFTSILMLMITLYPYIMYINEEKKSFFIGLKYTIFV